MSITAILSQIQNDIAQLKKDVELLKDGASYDDYEDDLRKDILAHMNSNNDNHDEK